MVFNDTLDNCGSHLLLINIRQIPCRLNNTSTVSSTSHQTGVNAFRSFDCLTAIFACNYEVAQIW